MGLALSLAQQAATIGEVPVGAVLVKDGEILGQGYNCPISTDDPTAHAEIVALRNASQRLGNYRLPATTMYVTLEPCTMCVGALVHARIERLVFGAFEPKAGVICSQNKLLETDYLNHNIAVTAGVLSNQCATILTEFFSQRRKKIIKGYFFT
jgi:tRNA(Arg) A34 adenosine deaminase TadA